MNKLDFSVSLREKGYDSNEIKEKMKAQGFDASEIPYYLKRSDEIFLNQLIQKNTTSKSKGKLGKGMKMILLVLSLLLLLAAFLGYARVGLIGLFIIWSIVGISSYR